jgi:hypothetical protein
MVPLSTENLLNGRTVTLSQHFEDQRDRDRVRNLDDGKTALLPMRRGRDNRISDYNS